MVWRVASVGGSTT